MSFAPAAVRAQLLEALERRSRLLSERDGLRLQNLPRVFTRLVQVAGAAERRHELDRRGGRGSQVLVAHGRDRLDRQPPDARDVVVHVVLGDAELVEVAADGFGRNAGVP